MGDTRRRYYSWRARHPQSEDVSIDTFTDIYRIGGGDALRQSTELAGLVAKLRELIWWFEASDVDVDDLDAEAATGSAYWKA